MMSMRRKIAGLRPEQIRALPKSELEMPVTMEDFGQAIARCNKSVSSADLKKYDSWMREFGSSWEQTFLHAAISTERVN